MVGGSGWWGRLGVGGRCWEVIGGRWLGGGGWKEVVGDGRWWEVTGGDGR